VTTSPPGPAAGAWKGSRSTGAPAIAQGTTGNGVFGAKVMFGYLPDLLGKLALDTMSVLDRARLVRLLDVRARVTGFCEETADWPYRFTLHIEGVIPLSAAGDPWDARTGGASAHPAAAATR
jgi:hypothetical protein